MSILFAILLFSFLVITHEFGHFITAKASGVQVNEFSVFMGPALWKKQFGETLYAVRLIPIGGYCAMEGEDGKSDNPQAFQKAAWWKRLLILIAGAAMNFLTGVILLSIVFAPVRNFVVPEIASFAEGCILEREDGLQAGDRFVSVDGERIFVQSDFSLILGLNDGEVHDIVIKRNGETVKLNRFRMEKRMYQDPDGTESLRFGFSFDIQKADFLSKCKFVLLSALDNIRNVRLSIQMLITGKAGLRDLSGPIGIVKIMADTAEDSATKTDAIFNLLYFGAFIAINLSVMNLLPLPALDGGRVLALLLTTAIEAVIHRKLNPKYEGYIHAAGMVLLLGLMAVIMFKDIFVLIKG